VQDARRHGRRDGVASEVEQARQTDVVDLLVPIRDH
jgi:hypothetical protein